MSINLSLPDQVEVEEERDTLGGGVLPSDVYRGKIDLVYMDKSDKGAISVNIVFKTYGERLVRQTVYISNKKGEFTYEKDGKKHPLPGYSQMDAFFTAATGKGIAKQETEEKTIKIYDFEQKAEVPVKRMVFTGATGQPLAIGIVHLQEEKTTADSGYKDGTGEFRDMNIFDKFFDPDTGLTNLEKKNGESEPAFLQQWKEKNAGQIRIKKAKNSGAATGATAGTPKPSKSLFG